MKTNFGWEVSEDPDINQRSVTLVVPIRSIDGMEELRNSGVQDDRFSCAVEDASETNCHVIWHVIINVKAVGAGRIFEARHDAMR